MAAIAVPNNGPAPINQLDMDGLPNNGIIIPINNQNPRIRQIRDNNLNARNNRNEFNNKEFLLFILRAGVLLIGPILLCIFPSFLFLMLCIGLLGFGISLIK